MGGFEAVRYPEPLRLSLTCTEGQSNNTNMACRRHFALQRKSKRVWPILGQTILFCPAYIPLPDLIILR